MPTRRFLAVKSNSPHDLTSVLIQADWFEARGEHEEAARIREVHQLLAPSGV